jgi:cytochrome c oxidase subunit 2
MKMKQRKLVLLGIASAFALISLIGAGSLVLAKPKERGERVVHIKVKRFEYLPKEITLKKDVPVVLELESLDVPHGFNLPDLSVRADVLPGRTARVRIVPKQAGRFLFHCDIFCGTGHEELEGAIVVKD